MVGVAQVAPGEGSLPAANGGFSFRHDGATPSSLDGLDFMGNPNLLWGHRSHDGGTDMILYWGISPKILGVYQG